MTQQSAQMLLASIGQIPINQSDELTQLLQHVSDQAVLVQVANLLAQHRDQKLSNDALVEQLQTVLGADVERPTST